MEGITGPLTAVLAHSQADKSSVDSSSAKRKRAEAELEEERGTPVLVHIENHTIHDDAHSEFDWVARSLRPYAGSQELYWKNQPRVSRPIIEDLQMDHFSKASINPNLIAKLHDRGAMMTGKQWLSSNYAVEGRWGKIRADSDKTAGTR